MNNSAIIFLTCWQNPNDYWRHFDFATAAVVRVPQITAIAVPPCLPPLALQDKSILFWSVWLRKSSGINVSWLLAFSFRSAHLSDTILSNIVSPGILHLNFTKWIVSTPPKKTAIRSEDGRSYQRPLLFWDKIENEWRKDHCYHQKY